MLPRRESRSILVSYIALTSVSIFATRPFDSYPYLTTLVLNAGMGAFLGLDWAAAARQFVTDPVGCVSEPGYIVQQKGKMSADGERGGVWGVNVLSTYILAKELHSHLQKSPSSLPTTPRVIYVSSARADPRFLPPIPADDPQLVDTLESYDASKYVAELVTSALDWEFAQRPGQAVRCLRVDPGVVYTGMFKPFLPLLLEWCMVLTFYIVSASHYTRWTSAYPLLPCSHGGSVQRYIPSE
ncbi:hypothetical protein QFC21_002480 [Naganishia friedmannii]|uniref:Uncharacterized protein n=1 Tax=Naganishia friedmannii TaxID=89922 RepID=A0ACC2VUH2_9TREE|nr:hypothetical protein QFC21_002480 [Naganishia friedmannii]